MIAGRAFFYPSMSNTRLLPRCPCGCDPSKLLMHSRSLLMPSGLPTTALTPRASIRLCPTESLNIVNKTMGVFGNLAFRIDAASTPFKPGMATSSRIKSGVSSVALSMACEPSAASPQTLKPFTLEEGPNDLADNLAVVDNQDG